MSVETAGPEATSPASGTDFSSRPIDWLAASRRDLDARVLALLMERRWGAPSVRVGYALDVILMWLADTQHIADAADELEVAS